MKLMKDDELIQAVLTSWACPGTQTDVEPGASATEITGGNGGDEHFGLWLPHSGDATPLVVAIGSIFEPRCMAVVGTSFGRFLLGRIGRS